MVTVKASQKVFTYAKVVNLTGICVEHLHNFATRRRLGFIARAAAAAGDQVDNAVHAVGLDGPGHVVSALHALTSRRHARFSAQRFTSTGSKAYSWGRKLSSSKRADYPDE